jgi:hypothetical protein
MCRFPSDIYATIISFLSQMHCDEYITLLSTSILAPKQASYHGIVTYTQNNLHFLKRSMGRLDYSIGIASLMVRMNGGDLINVVSILSRRPIFLAVFFAEMYNHLPPVFTVRYILETIVPFMKTVWRYVDKKTCYKISHDLTKHIYHDKRRFLIGCRFYHERALSNDVYGIYHEHGVDLASLIIPTPPHISEMTPDNVVSYTDISPTGLMYNSGRDRCSIVYIVVYWLLLGHDVMDVLSVWLPSLCDDEPEYCYTFIMYLYKYSMNPPTSGEETSLKAYLLPKKTSKIVDISRSRLRRYNAMSYENAMLLFMRPPEYVKLARQALSDDVE